MAIAQMLMVKHHEIKWIYLNSALKEWIIYYPQGDISESMGTQSVRSAARIWDCSATRIRDHPIYRYCKKKRKGTKNSFPSTESQYVLL